MNKEINNNEKIECNKCHSKFLTLGREKFSCTNCNNLIIKPKQNDKNPVNKDNIPEVDTEEFEEGEEDLSLFNEIID